jgi:hypothetical protein
MAVAKPVGAKRLDALVAEQVRSDVARVRADLDAKRIDGRKAEAYRRAVADGTLEARFRRERERAAAEAEDRHFERETEKAKAVAKARRTLYQNLLAFTAASTASQRRPAPTPTTVGHQSGSRHRRASAPAPIRTRGSRRGSTSSRGSPDGDPDDEPGDSPGLEPPKQRRGCVVCPRCHESLIDPEHFDVCSSVCGGRRKSRGRGRR